jgi:hypothetical protein
VGLYSAKYTSNMGFPEAIKWLPLEAVGCFVFDVFSGKKKLDAELGIARMAIYDLQKNTFEP